MKVKLDENLPLRLATMLKELGHDVHTVHEEQLMGHADCEIWEAAQKESRFQVYRYTLCGELENRAENHLVLRQKKIFSAVEGCRFERGIRERHTSSKYGALRVEARR